MGERVETRPELEAVESGAELRRWYWLKSELIDLARQLGVSPGGGKIELTDRIAARLDGGPPPARAGASGRSAAAQLVGPLTADTVIPAGQRSSQALRAFFSDAVGSSFRFDRPMREFIAAGEGRTLGEAVEHWHATRSRPRGEIAPQFELNRFVRAWHEAHPGGTRDQALAAWREHRARPVDQRE